MFEIALRTLRLPAKRRRSRKGRYDFDGWSWDPDTGEFHRILLNHREGTLISGETYADRLTKRLKVHRESRDATIALVISIASIALGKHSLYVLLEHGGAPMYPTAGYFNFDSLIYSRAPFWYPKFWYPFFVFGACGFLGGFFQWIGCRLLLASPSYVLGPKPISPPGLEEVERQKVHGVGGFAGQSAIDRAARGSARNGADQLTFND